MAEWLITVIIIALSVFGGDGGGKRGVYGHCRSKSAKARSYRGKTL